MERKQVSTSAPWESIVGYSRAVRVGDMIAVTGTVAVDEHGQPMHVGDAGAQTRYAIDRIAWALSELGSSLSDVIRTRIYVTDIERDWRAIGEAHGERFGTIRPATTMVEVSRLIAPGFLVEIEADAVAAQSPTSTK